MSSVYPWGIASVVHCSACGAPVPQGVTYQCSCGPDGAKISGVERVWCGRGYGFHSTVANVTYTTIASPPPWIARAFVSNEAGEDMGEMEWTGSGYVWPPGEMKP